MMNRINPRHLLRDAIRQLSAARCPECGRAFDDSHFGLGDCRRMVPLNCSWCGARAQTISHYADWLRQDAQIRDTPAARVYRERVRADQLRRARELASHDQG